MNHWACCTATCWICATQHHHHRELKSRSHRPPLPPLPFVWCEKTQDRVSLYFTFSTIFMYNLHEHVVGAAYNFHTHLHHMPRRAACRWVPVRCIVRNIAGSLTVYVLFSVCWGLVKYTPALGSEHSSFSWLLLFLLLFSKFQISFWQRRAASPFAPHRRRSQTGKQTNSFCSGEEWNINK